MKTILILFWLTTLPWAREGGTEAVYLRNLPFEMPAIERTAFPGRDFNIRDFGAVGDGHTLNSAAINRAMEKAALAGGGRVVIPRGIWLTGPIRLRSNVNLHLEEGALVQFTADLREYDIIETVWEGRPQKRFVSPLHGRGLENVAITGKGVFDGAGDQWRPVLKWEMTSGQWRALVEKGGVVTRQWGTDVWWPSEQAARGRETVAALDKREAPLREYRKAGEYLRPVLVSLINCRRVLLDGPTFQNSPAWNIHPRECEDVIIRNITVRNPWYSTNGDGLDIESCKNVLVYNSTFDVGDDAICLKSGRDAYGRALGKPAQNIVIANCTVYNGHGGFVIGSEMSGGVRNVLVRDCRFIGTDLGLRFKSARGRGGVVENIYIRDILMTGIHTDAIRFNTFYRGVSPGESFNTAGYTEQKPQPVTEETPLFRNIVMENITCRGAGRAIFIQGLPELAVREIELKNVHISAERGMTAVNAMGLKMLNLRIDARRGPAVHLVNSSRIAFEKTIGGLPPKFTVRLSGSKTGDVLFRGYDSGARGMKVIMDGDVSRPPRFISGKKQAPLR